MFQGMILYLILVIGAFIGWLLVPIYPFFLFFWMLLLLFIINGMIAFLTIKKTTLTYTIKKEILTRDQKAVLQITRNEKQIFPVGKVICHCYQEIGQEKKKYQICNTTLHQEITFPVTHCGVFTLTIYNEYYFDLLHTLFFKRKQNIVKEIIVFPMVKKIEYSLSSLVKESDAITKEYQKGQDNSEIFEIRNYQQGDTLRHIHWKLSMKKNELLVKTGSQLLQKEIMITYVVDTNDTNNDQTLDIFHTLCTSLNNADDMYTIGIYDVKSATMNKYLITNQEEYQQALYKIVLSLKQSYSKEQVCASCLGQAMYIIEKDQVIIVDSKGAMVYEKISLSA